METLRNWIKTINIQLFDLNDFTQQSIQLIQSNKKFAITLLVIAYFLINYSVLGYSIISKNSNLTRRSISSTIAGMSSEISSSKFLTNYY